MAAAVVEAQALVLEQIPRMLQHAAARQIIRAGDNPTLKVADAFADDVLTDYRRAEPH